MWRESKKNCEILETHFGSRPVVGGREREEKKNLGVAGFCALEWPDSRARVLERNLEPNKPRRPVLVVTRGEEKNQRSLAKPLILIEVNSFKSLNFSI